MIALYMLERACAGACKVLCALDMILQERLSNLWTSCADHKAGSVQLGGQQHVCLAVPD